MKLMSVACDVMINRKVIKEGFSLTAT